MLPVIEQIFHDYNEIFGSSKIYAILKDRGYAISESTVAKIMHENGMFSIRACAKTLYKQHQERKANILQQQFQVSRPNEVWVSDVTYFSVFGRMYYICVVLDLCQPRIIRTPPKRRYFRALCRIRLRPYSKYEQSRLRQKSSKIATFWLIVEKNPC